eukprot:TRINITY_DN2494_c0_g1_i18.p1 TRINITY_DN2494_c0_g1~~TRINITY_DN2494_c0_g1_i18.p1  ORF type:complete len:123 (+),score=10.97 TRINITY_DN2494_c0_g1_i18:48-416(+)
MLSEVSQLIFRSTSGIEEIFSEPTLRLRSAVKDVSAVGRAEIELPAMLSEVSQVIFRSTSGIEEIFSEPTLRLRSAVKDVETAKRREGCKCCWQSRNRIASYVERSQPAHFQKFIGNRRNLQ